MSGQAPLAGVVVVVAPGVAGRTSNDMRGGAGGDGGMIR
jgi:hypothetical protein